VDKEEVTIRTIQKAMANNQFSLKYETSGKHDRPFGEDQYTDDTISTASLEQPIRKINQLF